MGDVLRISCTCGLESEVGVGVGITSSIQGIEYRLGYCPECEDFESFGQRSHPPLPDYGGGPGSIGECHACGSDSIEPGEIGPAIEGDTADDAPKLQGPRCPACDERRTVIEIVGAWD